MLKKIMLILLSIQMTIMPTFIFALAPNTDKKPDINMPDGSPVKFPNRKPSTSSVAKVIKVGNAVALGSAVVEILGYGVEWLLEPDNNRIKYDVETGEWVYSTSHISLEHGFKDSNEFNSTNLDYIADRKCREQYKQYNASYNGRIKWDSQTSNSGVVGCILFNEDGSKYGDYASTVYRYKPTKENYLSLEEVAKQVIRNAEKGDSASIAAVNQALKDESETDPKTKDDSETDPKTKDDSETDPKTKDDSETDPKTKGDSETDPKTKDDSETDPKNKDDKVFCSWASVVCEFVEWAKLEQELKDEPTKVDIVDTEIGDWRSKANTNYVSSSNSCPADLQIPIQWGGISTSINISYQPFCYFASMIKPAVIMGAWISGLMIVTGGRSKE